MLYCENIFALLNGTLELRHVVYNDLVEWNSCVRPDNTDSSSHTTTTSIHGNIASRDVSSLTCLSFHHMQKSIAYLLAIIMARRITWLGGYDVQQMVLYSTHQSCWRHRLRVNWDTWRKTAAKNDCLAYLLIYLLAHCHACLPGISCINICEPWRTILYVSNVITSTVEFVLNCIQTASLKITILTFSQWIRNYKYKHSKLTETNENIQFK